MKLVVCSLAILGCSLALPSPYSIQWLQTLAWKDIKGKNVYIKPISNYTEDVPVDGRIVGGSEVDPNSVPYQVAIFMDGIRFCGGSLISPNFVLTAAHCTTSASFVQLIFGAHNIKTTESTQVRITSTNIINHPGFSSSSAANDVSLIKLPSAITISSTVQVITLADASAGDYAGSNAYLTGWGKISDSNNSTSSVLRGVTLNVITNAVCSSSYGSSIKTTNICTSGAGAVGGCNGDSGGPLVVGNVQVGVASFVSTRGCEYGLPTGYTRVSSYRSWIAENSDVSL